MKIMSMNAHLDALDYFSTWFYLTKCNQIYEKVLLANIIRLDSRSLGITIQKLGRDKIYTQIAQKCLTLVSP